MSYPNVIHGSMEEALKTRTTESPPVGTKMVVEDGRVFRFAEAAGVALVPCKLNEGVAPSANFLDETVGTLAAGVTVLTGVGATTGNCAASLVKYGYVWSSTATNLNPIMRIKDNTLCTAAASTGTITLYQPTVAAFAAADTISYIENPFRDIVVTPDATPLSTIVGVNPVAIALDAYGWVQTHGPARCLFAGTVVLGSLMIPAADAGSIGPAATQTTTVTTCIGYPMQVEATTEYGPVFLTIE